MESFSTAARADTPATSKLPDGLRLGPVHLMVTNLDRSIEFYEQVLGMQVHNREDQLVSLGAGGDHVLVLHESPGARRAGRHAGLFHVALLYPSRLELARVMQRIALAAAPVQGASDHHTHEAVYLADPDGIGLELAADRPRAQWPDFSTGGYNGRPDPLDLDSLLDLVVEAAPIAHAELGLAVGHLHLQVGDIEQGLAFYRDVIGFDVMTVMPTAAFVSAGGYHHHLGFNTWLGVGVSALPAGVAGLDNWVIELPAAEDVASVHARAVAAGVVATQAPGGWVLADPWNLRVLVRSGT